MTYLHCWVQIPIPIAIQTANQMATLYYVQLFTLHGVSFTIQFLTIPTTGKGPESEC